MATLRLFASIREIAEQSSLEVDVNNVSDAIAEACAQFGDDFAALVPLVAYGLMVTQLNQRIA